MLIDILLLSFYNLQNNSCSVDHHLHVIKNKIKELKAFKRLDYKEVNSYEIILLDFA